MDSFKWGDYPTYKQEGCAGDETLNAFYLQITIAATFGLFLFNFYVDKRQQAKILSAQQNRQLPSHLVGLFQQDTFEKSNDYGADKASFGLFESCFSFIQGNIALLLGFMPFMWDYSAKVAHSQTFLIPAESSDLRVEMMVTCVFIALTTIVEIVLAFPFSVYSTFWIEEKHGFNKQSFGLFMKDKVIAFILQVLIGSPLLCAFVWIVNKCGEHFYLYTWLLFLVFSIIMLTLFPVLIAPLFNKYEPLEEGPTRDAINKMAADLKFPLTKLFVVDGSARSSHSNAYFYGFFNNKRIVLYDTLIKTTTLPELLAILGHEMGHWALGHTMMGFIITQLYIFIMFLSYSYFQHSADMFTAFGFAAGGQPPTIIGLLLFMQTIWLPVDKIASIALNWNSRRLEFQADAFAKDLGMGEDMKSALIKISKENLGNLVPDSIYSLVHYSHPPVIERLQALDDNVGKDEAESKKNK